jgi:hypothetical protein
VLVEDVDVCCRGDDELLGLPSAQDFPAAAVDRLFGLPNTQASRRECLTSGCGWTCPAIPGTHCIAVHRHRGTDSDTAPAVRIPALLVDHDAMHHATTLMLRAYRATRDGGGTQCCTIYRTHAHNPFPPWMHTCKSSLHLKTCIAQQKSACRPSRRFSFQGN